jgi:sortase A
VTKGLLGERITFLAPEGRTHLSALDETSLKPPRVDIGEYPLRQFRMDIPRESTSHRPPRNLLRWIGYLFFLLGLMGAGIYGWFYAEARVYQAYENWRLNQIVRHGPEDLNTFLARYLGVRALEATKEPAPLKHLTELPFSSPGATVKGQAELPFRLPPAPIAVGALIGRIEIPRLSLSSVVLQGDSDQVLRKGVGHIPSTSLPGGPGNVAIAGHRDTFFRALKDIRQDDDITLTTTTGTYHYRVDSVHVVRPDDVQVLAPSDQASLTLVTCYPFYFVGSAPERYIVHAQQLEPTRAVQQVRPANGSPKAERTPDDGPNLSTQHADEWDSVVIVMNRVLYQLKTTLRAIYPPIGRRMQVWKNATRAQLEKERDRLSARIAAALESYINGDE